MESRVSFGGSRLTTLRARRAARSALSGACTPYQIGGCGFCSGSSSMGTPLKENRRPLKSSTFWVSPLILLCHKFRCLFRAAQHGQRESVVARAATNLRRIVAIEFGTWRSGRNGGSSRLVTFAYGNLRAQRGGTIS